MLRLLSLTLFAALALVGVFAAHAEPKPATMPPATPAATDPLDDLFDYCWNTQPPMGVSREQFIYEACQQFIQDDAPLLPTAGIDSPYSEGLQAVGRYFTGWWDSADPSRSVVTQVKIRIDISSRYHGSTYVDGGWYELSGTEISNGTWDYGYLGWTTQMHNASMTYGLGTFTLTGTGLWYMYAIEDLNYWVLWGGDYPSRQWQSFGNFTAATYFSTEPDRPYHSYVGVFLKW